MKVEEIISSIEGCQSLEDLKETLQTTIEDFGFASFNFLDVGTPHVDVPFYFGTTGEAWEDDYKRNNFITVDHCVHHARKTNIPFIWDEVSMPLREKGPKPGGQKLMDAAQDHGFKNGLVVPFHFKDQLGRTHSSLCVFYWKSSIRRFRFLIAKRKHDLHIVLIYWVQRAVDLVAREHRNQGAFFDSPRANRSCVTLTDRERDTLVWAARGKTAADTADILKIGTETVATHMQHSMRKLSATNKTHAVVKAVYLGLIDF